MTAFVRHTPEFTAGIESTSAAEPRSERKLRASVGSSHRGWGWLLLAAILLPFANLQTLVPVVAWAAPVLLLRFTRAQRLRVGLPTLVLVLSLTSLVALRGGFFPVGGGVGYAVLVAGIGLAGAVP